MAFMALSATSRCNRAANLVSGGTMPTGTPKPLYKIIRR
jgi:hypothetical protein